MKQIYTIILWFLLLTVIIGIKIPVALSVPSYVGPLQSVYHNGSCTTCHIGSSGVVRNVYGKLFESRQNHVTDPIVALQAIGRPSQGATPLSSSDTITVSQQTPPVPQVTSNVTPTSSLVPTSGPTIGHVLNKIVQVYYDDTFGSSYANIRYDSVTDILWAFVRVNGDGSLNYIGYGDPGGLISLAHSKGVRVILSVQETYGQADQLLGGSTARTDAINNLLSEVKTRGFDGIDIDIETATFSQRGGMTLFVQELYNTFKASNPNYRVSVAVSVTDYNDVFDGSAIKNYVDYIMIMAYDIYGDTSSVSGPVAPMLQDSPEYDSVDTGIDYWKNTETIPTNKTLLGVPYYGFDRPTVSSSRLANMYGSATWVYLNNVPSYNHDRYFDPVWMTPWQVWQEGNQWHQLQYEDVESLSYKYDKVKSENLAGIGIWTINYGSNRADLWQLIRYKFTI